MYALKSTVHCSLPPLFDERVFVCGYRGDQRDRHRPHQDLFETQGRGGENEDLHQPRYPRPRHFLDEIMRLLLWKQCGFVTAQLRCGLVWVYDGASLKGYVDYALNGLVNMVKVNKEGLIIEVQSRPALWREDHANFGRRDLTDKLWEEVAISCNILIVWDEEVWTLKEVYQNLPEGRMKNHIGKTTFSTSDRDTNPDLLIGSLISCESAALEAMLIAKQNVLFCLLYIVLGCAHLDLRAAELARGGDWRVTTNTRIARSRND
uniref:(California timema) hypothetical protein n=1 Tax=Timema californicum TaxID=61474 RepID=A0A7R9P575_TIMCA|nr:unnamed protein product [Timema californicum]